MEGMMQCDAQQRVKQQQQQQQQPTSLLLPSTAVLSGSLWQLCVPTCYSMPHQMEGLQGDTGANRARQTFTPGQSALTG